MVSDPWNPFEEVKRMQAEMEHLFDALYDQQYLPSPKGGKAIGASAGASAGALSARMPVTCLKETPEAVVATFELPGVAKENIELHVTTNSLEVKAQQRQEKGEQGENHYRITAVSSSFYRILPLPFEVKSDQAKAEYADGILKVTLPRVVAGSERRKVEIR